MLKNWGKKVKNAEKSSKMLKTGKKKSKMWENHQKC